MRDAMVLLSVELVARNSVSRSIWKETCQSCLEILRRCVYLDKDLVLPPVTDAGRKQTYFVVACTDLEHASVMKTRVQTQLEKTTDLKVTGSLAISAKRVPIPEEETRTLEERVQIIANSVTEMIREALGMSIPNEPPEQAAGVNAP